MTISDLLTVVHVPASIVVIITTSSISCSPIRCQDSSSLAPLKQEY